MEWTKVWKWMSLVEIAEMLSKIWSPTLVLKDMTYVWWQDAACLVRLQVNVKDDKKLHYCNNSFFFFAIIFHPSHSSWFTKP